MCGRTANALSSRQLVSQTRAREFRDDQNVYRPSYNVAPTRIQPILIDARGESSNQIEKNPDRVLQCMKWGLIPPWNNSTGSSALSPLVTINARVEKLKTGLWKRFVDSNRCVVPVQGFFEWLKATPGSGDGKKRPFYVKASDEILYLAGLYSCRSVKSEKAGNDDKKEFSYTIITVPSSERLAFLHDRMPAILDKADVDAWLDATKKFDNDCTGLLTSQEEGFEVVEVGLMVGKVGNDSEECVTPVDVSKKVGFSKLFGKTSAVKRMASDDSVSDSEATHKKPRPMTTTTPSTPTQTPTPKPKPKTKSPSSATPKQLAKERVEAKGQGSITTFFKPKS